MRRQYSALIFVALIRASYSHYVFPHLIVNGTVTESWKYVRDVAGEGIYATIPGASNFAKTTPLYDVNNPYIICGRDAAKAGPNTSIATVKAGDEIGFRMTDFENVDEVIFHQGPGLVYMSRAPNDDVQNYAGNGDWFKVAEAGPVNDTSFKLFDEPSMKFTIPKTTPPGRYLVRMEHIYLFSTFRESQFYVNCAQVNIVGPGGGQPKPLVKFPGAYAQNDPGILVTAEQGVHHDLLRYKMPGPMVWQG